MKYMQYEASMTVFSGRTANQSTKMAIIKKKNIYTSEWLKKWSPYIRGTGQRWGFYEYPHGQEGY